MPLVPLPEVFNFVSVPLSPSEKLPLTTFKQLLHGLQPFLQPVGDSKVLHLSLANADIETAVKQRYMSGPGNNMERAFHTLLAGEMMLADHLRKFMY